MELHADEPGMVVALDDLGQHAVGRHAGHLQARGLDLVAIADVDLVAVPVALGDVLAAIDLGDLGPGRQHCVIGAQPHGAAKLLVGGAGDPLVALDPLGHQADDRIGRGAELGRGGVLHAGHVPHRLDHRHLHAEADAEIGHLALAGELGRPHLPLRAPLTEAAGHQDAVHPLEPLGGRAVVALEGLGLDPVEIDLDVVGHPAVDQGLDEGFVGVLQHRVLADHRDGDVAVGIGQPVRDPPPARQVRLRGLDAEAVQHLRIQTLLVIVERHGVDVRRIQRLDHRRGPDVAELADLALLVGRDRLFAAAEQDVRLDADGPELAHRVLGRLGLHLARRLDERQQGEVDEDGVVARQLLSELADGLEERQALDVADRAADLDQHEVDIARVGQDEAFDLVGDVRDHLHRRAEVVPAPLPLEDRLVDLAGGDVVGLGRRDAGEALVMAKVEVGLGPVVGDEDLAVLIGAHRPRIDVQIGVEFTQSDLEAPRLQKSAESRGGEAFAE